MFNLIWRKKHSNLSKLAVGAVTHLPFPPRKLPSSGFKSLRLSVSLEARSLCGEARSLSGEVLPKKRAFHYEVFSSQLRESSGMRLGQVTCGHIGDHIIPALAYCLYYGSVSLCFSYLKIRLNMVHMSAG